MKEKKINFPKIIWITSIFALLIVILIMVMDYKINYEYSNSGNNKIYFYNCEGEICTSSKKLNKELYSEYICYTACPQYKGTINEDYALLKNENGYILYNYKEGLKIAEDYNEYKFLNDQYIIVTKNNKEGVIDSNHNITLEVKYTQIGYYKNSKLTGYNTKDVIVKSDNVYGILNYKTGEVVEEIKYKENEVDKLLEIINKN